MCAFQIKQLETDLKVAREQSDIQQTRAAEARNELQKAKWDSEQSQRKLDSEIRKS